MDRRFLTFGILAALVFALWLFAQRVLIPPKPPAPPPVVQKVPDKKPDVKPGDPPPAGVETEKQPDDSDASIKSELIGLGSVDPASPYRMHVTFTNRGAAVERIELTDYSELADHPDEMFGYLGYLGLEQSPTNECVVGIVPAGTPAAKAGLLAGDAILGATNGNAAETPIKRAADFHAFNLAAQPGDSVTLRVRRDVNGQSQTLTLGPIALLVRPMQVIRPQTVDFTNPWAAKPSVLKPNSYLMTLAHVGSPDEKGTDYALDALPPALRGLKEGKWEITRRPTPADPTVEFTRRINAPRLSALGGEGGLRVVKRYTLAKAAEDHAASRLARAYHLTFELEIHNETPKPLKLAYHLDGPTGLPEEGWWYAYKVHPTYWNGAGTRDILYSSNHEPRMFITSDLAHKSQDEKDPLTPLLGKGQQMDYAAVDAIYFSAVMMAEPKGENTFDPLHDYTYDATLAGRVGQYNTNKPTRTDVTYHLTSTARDVVPGAAFKHRFTVFAGPKEPALLDQYGLGHILVFGWFAWFAWGLLFILHLIYAVFANYGVAIILLTVVVRLAVYPISRQVALSSQAMQELQPEIEKIKEQYKDNLQKQTEATQALYAKHGVNPAAGCLFMPLQMPIFIGLYRGLAIDIALRGAPLIPGVAWCSNLAGPDMFWHWQPVLEPLGMGFLVGEYGFLGPYLNILPILTMILFVWQAKQFQQPAANEEQEMMQNVSTFMMVFMGFLFFKVSSGLCLYFIASSIWGIAEKWYVTNAPKEVKNTEPTEEQLSETAKEIQAKKERRKRARDMK